MRTEDHESSHDITESPFASGRWEQESNRHYFHLDSEDFRKLSTTYKHCFLIGHRGTGKTTLLRALEWRERSDNSNLQTALANKQFDDRVIGCYFAFKATSLGNFDGWLIDEGPQLQHLIQSSYIRSLWIEEAASAVRSVAMRFENYSLATEVEHLKPVADRILSWSNSDPINQTESTYDSQISLSDIRTLFSRLRNDLWSSSILGAEAPGIVAIRNKLDRLAELTNAIFGCLANLLTALDLSAARWTFRMCMDEAEYLSPTSELVIRTMIRECDSPVFMIVASLNDIGITTLHQRVTLTIDDRYILDLDDRSPTEMTQLVDGIIRARLRMIFPTPDHFSLRSLLGKPDLNDLLLLIRTENPRFAEAQSSWRLKSSQPEAWNTTPRGWSPIREYLQATKSIHEKVPPTRAEDSAGYRKKKLAGYLQLLADYDVSRPMYAGSDIAISMSDNSVRNLFLFLEETRLAWIKAKRTINSRDPDGVAEFLALTPVPYQIQDTGLKLLGERKLDGFEDRIINFTQSARRLVDLTAKISRRIDSGSKGGKISSHDRTRLRVRIDKSDAPRSATDIEQKKRTKQTIGDKFISILMECHEEGFLRLLSFEPQSGVVTFEVHRSLSRFYGFGYHVPSNTHPVEWAPIRLVLEEGSSHRLEALAADAVKPQGKPSISTAPGVDMVQLAFDADELHVEGDHG